MTTATAIGILAAITTAPAALAQPAVLDVDPAQSSINLEITLDTALGSRTDNDSATITGQMTIELDDYAAPTTIAIIDYNFAAGPLSFAFDYGFLGSVNASTTNTTMAMPNGAPPATGTVDAAGDFIVAGVPNQTTGLVMVTGTGAIGGLIDDTTVDLATLDQQPITISGNVSVNSNTITIDITLPLDGTGTDPGTGVTVTFTGTAAVVATGPVPDMPCLPDVNGDGQVTPTDFTAWINAFNNNLPECDQNNDGQCTPTDFTAWIANFNAGCP